ncbi:hypothetical protein M8J77_021130 [Diaphorina citri]|nr:hypothetical protein M8J77_021130 [Diaphorina citri]
MEKQAWRNKQYVLDLDSNQRPPDSKFTILTTEQKGKGGGGGGGGGEEEEEEEVSKFCLSLFDSSFFNSPSFLFFSIFSCLFFLLP